MSENTFMQMESPLFRDQSGVPAEQLYKTVTLFLAADGGPAFSL